METYYVPIAIFGTALVVIAYHYICSKKTTPAVAQAVSQPSPVTVAHLQAAVAQITGAQHTAETVAQIAAKQVEHGAKLDTAAKRVEDLHARWDKDDAEKGKADSPAPEKA